MKAKKTKERPAFNHTREDGPFDPCQICLQLMRRKDLVKLVEDLRSQLAEARQCPILESQDWMALHGISM